MEKRCGQQKRRVNDPQDSAQLIVRFVVEYFLLFFLFFLYQCCGSRSAWIRILLTVLDPDLYWECGSRSRSMEIDQNLQINLVSCLSKRFLYLSRYRYCRVWPTVCDLDPHLFISLRILLRIKSWIRILIEKVQMHFLKIKIRLLFTYP